MKLTEALTGVRRQALCDGVDVDGHKKRVAFHAAHKRIHPLGKIEPLQHFDELPFGIRLPNPVAMPDQTALEQPDVARQRDASFRRRHFRDFSVVCAQQRVKSCETQQRSELSQMDVEYEAHRLWRVSSHTMKPGDIDTVELGIHGHVIAILHAVGELCRLSVDDDDVDFGMWDAKGFDHVLDRSRTAQRMGEPAMSPLPRQEIIQSPVKAESAHDFIFACHRGGA